MAPQALSNSRSEGVLTITWDDGASQNLSNQQLRASCRCTVCESARRKGVLPAVDEAVRIEQINPIGSYGVQFVFSDGHERGIYPWAYLHGLEIVASSEIFSG